MFISKLDLSPQELDEKESEFKKMVLDPESEFELYTELKNFFNSNENKRNQNFEHTYWRWYCKLSWERLNAMGPEEVLDLVRQQIPTALKLGFQIDKEIMMYLSVNYYFDFEKLSSYFISLQREFLESKAVIGKEGEITVSLADIIKDWDNQGDRDESLYLAEHLGRLKKIFFPVQEAGFYKYYDEQEKVVKNFQNLLELFLYITEDEIWQVLDLFLHRERVSVTNSNTASKLPLFSGDSIKEKVFKDNVTDPRLILERLQQLAEQYNDPAILEMYYYDEAEGKFKWKNE